MLWPIFSHSSAHLPASSDVFTPFCSSLLRPLPAFIGPLTAPRIAKLSQAANPVKSSQWEAVKKDATRGTVAGAAVAALSAGSNGEK